MLEINREQFERVVAAAKEKCGNNDACKRAIDRAVEQVYENPYMAYTNDGVLLTAGATTKEIYHATSATCECPAFIYGNRVCWHRTLAKLMQRYQESLMASVGAAPRAMEAAVVVTGGTSREVGAGNATDTGVVRSSSRLQEGTCYERNGRSIRTVTCDGWAV